MSRLYEIGVIDNATAGWGTIWVQEKGKLPTYLIPENPVEVIHAVNGWTGNPSPTEEGEV